MKRVYIVVEHFPSEDPEESVEDTYKIRKVCRDKENAEETVRLFEAWEQDLCKLLGPEWLESKFRVEEWLVDR